MKFIQMKKSFLFYALVLILVWSCDFKPEPQPIDTPLPDEVQSETMDTQKAEAYAKSALKQSQWESYYQEKMDDFAKEDFKKENAFKIERSPSTVTPIWEEKFNPIYKEFFSYNADSTKYIDIDSYKWSIDEQGELSIAPDQEIALVNIPEKKVERILFYGTSFWVEDAYFKNDSVIVLLENSTDKIPAYQEINLNQNTSKYYIYKKALDFDSDYYKNRMSRMYKSVP